MKSFFDNATAQVNAELAAKPINGNEELVTKTFGNIQRQAAQQSFGLVQLMMMAAVAKAANAQHAEMDDVIKSVRSQLSSEGNHFDATTREYLQNALENPAELMRVLQNASQASAPPSRTSEVPTLTSEVPATTLDKPVVAPDATLDYRPPVDSSNVLSFVKIIDDDSREDEIKGLIKLSTWLHMDLPAEPYSLQLLPGHIFDRLWGAYNVKAGKTESEVKISNYLTGLKTARTLGSTQKVG